MVLKTNQDVREIIPFQAAFVKEGILRMLDCVLSKDKKFCNK
jgi:hypothetical protein